MSWMLFQIKLAAIARRFAAANVSGVMNECQVIDVEVVGYGYFGMHDWMLCSCCEVFQERLSRLQLRSDVDLLFEFWAHSRQYHIQLSAEFDLMIDLSAWNAADFTISQLIAVLWSLRGNVIRGSLP